MNIALHITHESARKIGGIGAVLSGVCTLDYYKDFYERTIFYGPLFDLPSEIFPVKSGKLLFSSHDNYDTGGYYNLWEQIIEKYGVDIVYGRRELASDFDITKRTSIEVINVTINKMKHDQVEKFKYSLWKNYDIKSHLYEHDWDYEQYLRIAVPYMEIIEKLCPPDANICHFAHEYMGVPSALAAVMSGKKQKTVFVAHEVTTARSLVEDHTGADISFYNMLQMSKDQRSLEQVFGSQEHHSRTELIKRAVNFDHIFAVGDHVKEEYLFLAPQAPPDKVKVVYNGVSARKISFEQKEISRKHLQQYTEALLNFRPDIIFTHVTRLVISKGIWRDIAMLYHMDNIFAEKGIKGVYILLSSQITVGRSSSDIFRMENDYGWPVLHRHGWPDLIGAESQMYEYLQIFNSRSKAIKGLIINQFGFNRTTCGQRVPEDADFQDIRIGSDAELGFSTYEPFGIAQIETVPFGGVALMSSSCGCAGFMIDKFKDAEIKPYCILDYISAGKNLSYDSLKYLSLDQRNEMENQILSANAKRIFDTLPITEDMRRQYLQNAQNHAEKISWQTSARHYLLD